MEYFWLIVIIILILVGLFFTFVLRRVVIFEYERGILYRNGKFNRVLEPWFSLVVAMVSLAVDTFDAVVETVFFPAGGWFVSEPDSFLSGDDTDGLLFLVLSIAGVFSYERGVVISC